MVLSELVGILGFKFDDKELNKFEQGIKTATKSLAVVGTALAAAGAATFAFVNDVASTNDELGKLSQRLGINTSDIQAWQYAAELGGASGEAMTSSLENLSKVASEAARGVGAGVEVFGMLGISAVDAGGQIKGTSILMEEIADRMSRLETQSQKLEFANKLGISSDLIVTLQQGSQALRQQRLEAEALGFTLDKNATQSAANFKDELLRVSKIIQGVGSSIATGLMPEITEMLKFFKMWFIANKDIIRQNLKAFLGGVVTTFRILFDIAKRVWNVFDALAQATGGWTNALLILSGVLTAINAKILLIPFLITALAVAVFLAVEDIITYFQGGESAIGDFIEVIRSIPSKALDYVKGKFEDFKNYVIKIWDTIAQKITEIGSKIKDSIMKPINEAKNLFNSIFGNNEVKLSPQVAPSAVQSSNSFQSSNQFSASFNINAGNGDPQIIAQSVSQEMDRWFAGINTQTKRDFASPIKG